jgi:glycosyltransferase involved in cell wall biosynthesis
MTCERPRALIASDDSDLLAAVVKAYYDHGFDVTTGVRNFEFEASRVDLLHVRWPEELTEWRAPSDRRLAETERRLDRWLKSARLIVSVNNLYPHGHYRDAQFHRLYTMFYERADVIHHFSETSLQLVREEYPSIANRNHVVRVGFNYDHILPAVQPDREKIRAEMGARPDDVVFLLFGALRSHEEVMLIRSAFDKARVERKRLLWCARYFTPGTLRGRLERYGLEAWRRRNKTIYVRDYIPDEEIYRPVTAADVVVSVRLNILNSGLPSLGMTFGRFVVAADVGSSPEFLAGAGNALYDPSSADSLARALEKAGEADREQVGARNRQIAEGWTWSGAIGACLEALGDLRRRPGRPILPPQAELERTTW